MTLKGQVVTAEHRAKLRAANLGKRHSPETKAKMRAAKLGKSKSVETRARMSAAQHGVVRSLESRQRQSASRMGCIVTPEHRAKLSAALMGYKRGPFTAEHRQKLSEAKRGKPGPWTGLKRPDMVGHPAYHAAKYQFWHRGIRMRSSYEVRMARAMDAIGLSWQYEPTRFRLSDTSYTPDFYLPTEDVFWECKGWFSPISQRKVSEFRRTYSHIALVVMNKDCLELLERRAAVVAA